jgi:molybdopterin-biosynthesis enzyme MoeA-like protein
LDDLTALVAAAIAGGFIDIDTCKEKAEELERASAERDERIISSALRRRAR